MQNWAIVIGINKYADSKYNLKGAVKDALSMKKWLLDPKGGNVPRNNLYVMLSDENNPAIPENNLEPTINNIEDKINIMLNDSGGKGDRLYFYCAGHGLSAIIDYHDKDAIVASNFDGTNIVQGTISIKSLIGYFKTREFKEQFFFFDTCRNNPYQILPKDIGEFSNVSEVKLEQMPITKQYVYYATSPGQEAYENDVDGERRGAFTNALIYALQGGGSAKRYDVISSKYVVKSDNLIDYLSKQVAESLAPGMEKFVNLPTLDGSKHQIAEIVTFEKNIIPNVEVEVNILPETILPNETKIQFNGIIEKINPEINSLSFKKEIPQDDYGVIATTKNFESKELGLQIYEPRKILIDMKSRDPDISEDVDEALKNLKKGKVTLFTEDSQSLLQIIDKEEKIIKSGRGELEAELNPGLYKGKLVLPNGQNYTKIIALLSGEKKRVTMIPPQISKISRGLIEKSGFGKYKNVILISENVGPMINPELSTVLALASRAADYEGSEQWDSYKLKQTGIEGFKKITNNARQGIHIIFGSEWNEKLSKEWEETNSEEMKKQITEKEDNRNREFVENLEIEILAQSGERIESMPRKLEIVNQSGIGEIAQELEAGTYLLSFGLIGQRRIIYSITVLSGRITHFVIQKNSKGSLRVSQYLPKSSTQDSQRDIYEIRKMSVLEQYYSSNIMEFYESDDWRQEDIHQLAYDKWVEPMAGCVSGYLSLQNFGEHNVGLLRAIGRNMSTHFGGIPDSHVIRGKFSNFCGDKNEAIVSYKEALKIGLPIFTEGLETLYYAIKEYNLTNGCAEEVKRVFEKRIRDSIWTCYVSD